MQTTFNELYAVNTCVPFVRHLVVNWKICLLCSFFRYSRPECQLNLLMFVSNHVSLLFTQIALHHLEHSVFPLCGFRTLVGLLNVLFVLIEMYDYTVEVRNRFKGIDLIDRVPHELWTEVCDIVQESRPSPRKRNAKKQNGCLRRPYNSCEKKRSEKQRRKGKIYPFECRVPKNSKERQARKPSSGINAKK